jgi:hypothetical protein
LALVLLIVPCLAGVLSVTPASAGLDLCRTDPILVLSNGAQIHLKAVIADGAADVQGVQYVVQLPPGVTIIRTTYNGSALRGKESVATGAQAGSGSATVETLVTTGASNVPVAVSASVPAGSSATQSGYAGQPVSVTLTL